MTSEMTPETAAKVDNLVHGIRRNDTVLYYLGMVARHYKVEPQEVSSALLTPRILLACALTDFTKQAGPGDFAQLLKQQNALEIDLANRMTQLLQRASDAVVAAENLQEEATRLLAKLRKEMEEKGK